MNTSKLLVLALCLLISATSIAQKGSVNKADSYLAKKDYANAKAEIDMAITIEKNVGKSKTWFVRGKIYQNIASSEDETVTALDPDALTKSVEAYNKVKEMENENNPSHALATNNLGVLWGALFNRASENYNQEDYTAAVANFEKALLVKPTDSVTLLYAGVSAQLAEDPVKTMQFYYQLLENDDATSDVVSTLIFYERTVTKNNENALKLVLKAKELFPEESKFGQEEISLLLTMEKIDEAKVKLEEAIAADPSNANLHVNQGILYDNLGSALMSEGKNEEGRAAYNQALESYKNAINVEADNFIGNFNSGVIYVNMAKEYFDRARDMDLKTYQKKGPALEDKGKAILNEGLPFLEKSAEIRPDEIDVLRALQQVYSALKMYDKAEPIMDKLDELEGAQ